MADNTQVCASCTQPGGIKGLLKCGRCKGVSYCSKKCQTDDWLSHKISCKRPNYILEFHLCPDHISDPPVKRTLSCPAEATFAKLHIALQSAFGWATTHLYEFAVRGPNYPTARTGGQTAEAAFRIGGQCRFNSQEYRLKISESTAGDMSFVNLPWEITKLPSKSTKLYRILANPAYSGKTWSTPKTAK